MPTLDLPNLQKITQQKQTTPPPIAQISNPPIGPAGSPATTQPCQPCYPCARPSYNLTVEQGATFTSQITIQVLDAAGNLDPVDVTGFQFQFTAKTDLSIPDTDPSVIMVDWQETTTPQQGITSLVIPASVTATMQLAAYFYQIRMVSASGVVSPLVTGTITVTQPVSPRF